METIRTIKALNASAKRAFVHAITVPFLYTFFTSINPRIRVAIEPIRLTVSTCFFDLVKKHNIPVNIGARRRYSIMLSTYQIFEQIRIYTFKCFVYPENQDTHDKNPYQDIKKNPDLNK